MAQKPRIMARKKRPVLKDDILRGAVLFLPVSAGEEYRQTITSNFTRLASEAESEIKRLFRNSDSPVLDGATLDASITNQATKLLGTLRQRFEGLFSELADRATKRMIERTTASSGSNVKKSLENIGAGVSLNVNMAAEPVKEVIRASSIEAANLIKRVPSEYLDAIGGDVMRSIISGRGLADLQPALEKQKVKVRNWAKNVALDQTRKVYNAVNREAIKSAGIRKFEWIHGGGSNDPREYHLLDYPAGLNGGIFDMDDPPIIDKRTGERGYPGQLPFCRCTMRPVVDLSEA